jgi:hypothetical protein
MIALRLTIALAVISVLAAPPAIARPERIRPGESYYSDDFVEVGLVRDIAEEKNYEEVYQFYTYYEVIYDASERVVTFIEYKRGEIDRREQYRYAADGSLKQREVQRPGKPAEVTNLPLEDESTAPDPVAPPE